MSKKKDKWTMMTLGFWVDKDKVEAVHMAGELWHYLSNIYGKDIKLDKVYVNKGEAKLIKFVNKVKG